MTHIRRDGIVRTLEHDAADQLLRIRQGQSPTGPVLETFTYDGAGRRTRHTAGGVETIYTYDALDRLTGVRRADGSHAVTLAYTALGARYRRTETGQSDAFFFAGFAERREGTGLVRLILGRDADHVLAEVAAAGGGVARTLLPDAQGHMRWIAEGGALGGERRFEAFGGEIFRTLPPPADPVERGYAGRPAEGATGLLPFGPRHYDPATGGFLQPDPLFADVRYLYAYARHNPYVFGDPTGLLPESISGGYDFGGYDFDFDTASFGSPAGFDLDVASQSGGSEGGILSAARNATDVGLRAGLFVAGSFRIVGVLGATVDLDVASFNPDLVDPRDDRFTSGLEISVDVAGFPLGFELFRREINVSEVGSPLRDLFSQPSRSEWILPTQVRGGGPSLPGRVRRLEGGIGALFGVQGSFDIRQFFREAFGD